MRLVIQIVKDRGLVRIDRREILPERQAVGVGHGMLADVHAPFVAIRPMQIQNDVAALRRAGVHRLMHQIAIGFPAIGLFGRLAEPAILAKRQADDVGVPVLDGDVERLENMSLAGAGPFQAGGIDAPQPNGLVLAVENLRSNDVKGRGHVRGVCARRGCLGLAVGCSREQGRENAGRRA